MCCAYFRKAEDNNTFDDRSRQGRPLRVCDHRAARICEAYFEAAAPPSAFPAI